MVTCLPKMASASRLGSRVWLASRGSLVVLLLACEPLRVTLAIEVLGL